MNRLQILANNIAKQTYVDSSLDYMKFYQFLTPQEDQTRRDLRHFLQTQISPSINQYVERAQFPQQVIAKLRKQNLYQHMLKEPYGKPFSYSGMGILIAEFSRVDAGLATFFLVQYALAMFSIQALGSQQQKKKYLPDMKDLKKIGGWGLTQVKIGSDASNLQTSATKVQGGYKLNGTKRWIGNGNRDMLIAFARNTQNKKVQGFIVDMNSQGVTSTVIKNKLALRIVQNCQIHFNNVFIPEEDKLPKAVDFAKGTAVILKHSRIFVCWIAAGICIGVYDNAIKYISNRKQFGMPISSYQLVQEKITRIMANVQAVILMCWRISYLAQRNKATMGQIAMCKAFATQRLRQIAKLGRQIQGGNGITLQNYVMKAMADAQAIYTYQGTYDINTLVAARQITGISSFKVPKNK